MQRTAGIITAVVVAAACTATPGPSSTPVASVAVTSSPAEVPTAGPTSTPRPTPTPVTGVGLCPMDSPLTVWQLVGSDIGCFAGDDVVVRGWLDVPPATGFEPPEIQPGWIAYPPGNLSVLWGGVPVGPDQTCVQDDHGCGWIFAHIDPASGVVLVGPPRWLLVSGHFQDPAAETCHYVYPADYTDVRADDRNAVAHCRTSFVLVSVRDAS